MSKLRAIGATGVLALALAVIAWREAQPQKAAAGQATKPQVMLFVDLSEEGEEAGCGAIIHAVRAVAKRGVATEEVDAREPGERAKQYRLVVAPTVLLLDADGHETRRFEGEAPSAVNAIHDELGRLAPR
jgi:hypothetical protein